MIYLVFGTAAGRGPVSLQAVVMALYEVFFWACHRDYGLAIPSCRI